MCGIAGIFRLKEHVLLKPKPEVLNILKHRGPDAQKYHAYEEAIFYHARLSIIDLSDYSIQPFLLNEDICLVFNGEIFNYQELAKSLNIPHPKSDTEVLIKHFDKHRIAGLPELNGFFAFAFYDRRNQELFVVRDRYGEKPLYYYQDEEVFAFASEIHPLLAMVQKKFALNPDVLYTYFRLHYIAGEQSILQGIKRLLPGHYIHIQNGKTQVARWYDIEEKRTELQTLSFESLMQDAVQKRLISDAPLGAFLSGGIDSSVVCAVAKQYQKELHTFSLGYKDENRYNETSDATIVANHIGSIHHNFEISVQEIQAELPTLLQTIDEPFADSSAINVYFLSKKIKPYATAAISGDGADELLMGYNKHKILLLNPAYKLLSRLVYPFVSWMPSSRSFAFANLIRKVKKFAYAAKLTPLQQFIFLSQWANEAYLQNLFHQDLKTHYFDTLFQKYEHLHAIKLFNLADLQIVLTNDMLYKTDFFGMQQAVEIRSPFLDHRIVEYLYHAPFDQKIHNNTQKYLLRKTFAKLLPQSVFTKKKSGFEIPLHRILPPLLQNHPAFSKDYILNQNIFRYETIHQLKQQLPTNADDAALKLWTLWVFQAWYQKFEPYIQQP